MDCRLEDPDGTTLYKEMKKQYDSFTFTAAKNGTFKFCFSNEFSTFTHKTVYFDFQVGDDPPLFPNENRVTALTQVSFFMKMLCSFQCCTITLLIPASAHFSNLVAHLPRFFCCTWMYSLLLPTIKYL